MNGRVQHSVAEGGDLAAGQLKLAGEAEQFGPGNQIGCGHDDFRPCTVGGEGVKRQVARAGGFGAADAVLDAGMLAMSSSSPASWPGMTPLAVSVRNPVMTRCPSEPVKRSRAPGRGRSSRRISPVPAGQADRSTRSMASATQAPSRMPSPPAMSGRSKNTSSG